MNGGMDMQRRQFLKAVAAGAGLSVLPGWKPTHVIVGRGSIMRGIVYAYIGGVHYRYNYIDGGVIVTKTDDSGTVEYFCQY